MGFMVKSYFANNPLLAYPLLALGVFILVFVLVVVRTALMRPARYDALARLPFEQTKEATRA